MKAQDAVIALLGAESTGKTTLAHALHQSLQAQGHHVALVEEALREFCVRNRRTPRRDEQAGIARTQSLRIAEAARTHELVVVDTTSMMVAVDGPLLVTTSVTVRPGTCAAAELNDPNAAARSN